MPENEKKYTSEKLKGAVATASKYYKPGGANKPLKAKKSKLKSFFGKLFKKKKKRNKDYTTTRTDYVDRRLKMAGMTQQEINSLKNKK